MKPHISDSSVAVDTTTSKSTEGTESIKYFEKIKRVIKSVKANEKQEITFKKDASGYEKQQEPEQTTPVETKKPKLTLSKEKKQDIPREGIVGEAKPTQTVKKVIAKEVTKNVKDMKFEPEVENHINLEMSRMKRSSNIRKTVLEPDTVHTEKAIDGQLQGYTIAVLPQSQEMEKTLKVETKVKTKTALDEKSSTTTKLKIHEKEQQKEAGVEETGEVEVVHGADKAAVLNRIGIPKEAKMQASETKEEPSITFKVNEVKKIQHDQDLKNQKKSEENKQMPGPAAMKPKKMIHETITRESKDDVTSDKSNHGVKTQLTAKEFGEHQFAIDKAEVVTKLGKTKEITMQVDEIKEEPTVTSTVKKVEKIQDGKNQEQSKETKQKTIAMKTEQLTQETQVTQEQGEKASDSKISLLEMKSASKELEEGEIVPGVDKASALKQSGKSKEVKPQAHEIKEEPSLTIKVKKVEAAKEAKQKAVGLAQPLDSKTSALKAKSMLKEFGEDEVVHDLEKASALIQFGVPKEIKMQVHEMKEEPSVTSTVKKVEKIQDDKNQEKSKKTKQKTVGGIQPTESETRPLKSISISQEFREDEVVHDSDTPSELQKVGKPKEVKIQVQEIMEQPSATFKVRKVDKIQDGKETKPQEYSKETKQNLIARQQSTQDVSVTQSFKAEEMTKLSEIILTQYKPPANFAKIRKELKIEDIRVSSNVSPQSNWENQNAMTIKTWSPQESIAKSVKSCPTTSSKSPTTELKVKDEKTVSDIFKEKPAVHEQMEIKLPVKEKQEAKKDLQRLGKREKQNLIGNVALVSLPQPTIEPPIQDVNLVAMSMKQQKDDQGITGLPIFVADTDFDSEGTDATVSLTEGEKVEVIESTEDKIWKVRRLSTEEQGLAPSEILKPEAEYIDKLKTTVKKVADILPISKLIKLDMQHVTLHLNFGFGIQIVIIWS